MKNNQLHFELCDECLTKYLQLSYDPACQFEVIVIPLCSISWPDEHPENGEWLGDINDPDGEHAVCGGSIFKLLGAKRVFRNT